LHARVGCANGRKIGRKRGKKTGLMSTYELSFFTVEIIDEQLTKLINRSNVIYLETTESEILDLAGHIEEIILNWIVSQDSKE
jgi:hypothetical protein